RCQSTSRWLISGGGDEARSPPSLSTKFSHRRSPRFALPRAVGEAFARTSLKPATPRRTGRTTVIDLYTWTTPNGRKASILLEELALPYTAHAVDISKDEQFKPEFLKISPNNRIPAIVDRDTGVNLMESAAIMIYLADKTGKLLPKAGEPRYRALEWLMWQMGGPGPMFGQVHHFVKYNKGKAPYAEERFLKEAHRLYGVLDRRLACASALRRARPQARRSRIRRRRLFHRRY